VFHSTKAAMTDTSIKKIAMIVEDEAVIRLMAVDFLRELGFASIEAASAQEALALMGGRADTLAFMMIDMGLPDRSGAELAGELRRNHRSLPILIASGQPSAELETRIAADPLMGFLGKPYTAEMLGQALKAIGIDKTGPS
jgi:CheY-like chemotaxis protein